MALSLRNRLIRSLLLNGTLENSLKIINQPHISRQVQPQLRVTGRAVSQRRSCDESEKKRIRGDCPSTKTSSIKQDVASLRRAAAYSLSLVACRLPDKLIRDEVPQGPWNPSRAPEFPAKCYSPYCLEKPDCDEPCCPPDECKHEDACPVPDEPWDGEPRICSFESYARKFQFLTGWLSRDLQCRGLHGTGLKCGAGKGHCSGKSVRKKKKKTRKKSSNSSKTPRKGKEICTKGPREKCFGPKKAASNKKSSSCEPDVSWKDQICMGHPRGSDTCSIDKPKCNKNEALGPSYHELEKSFEDKRIKAVKRSTSADKCHPNDSWKEGKNCKTNSETCSTGKPTCDGSKRSYSTLSRIVFDFPRTRPSRSMWSEGGLRRECDANNRDGKGKAKSDIFKKELREIEDCITAAKCKVPRDAKPSNDGKVKKEKK